MKNRLTRKIWRAEQKAGDPRSVHFGLEEDPPGLLKSILSRAPDPPADPGPVPLDVPVELVALPVVLATKSNYAALCAFAKSGGVELDHFIQSIFELGLLQLNKRGEGPEDVEVFFATLREIRRGVPPGVRPVLPDFK